MIFITSELFHHSWTFKTLVIFITREVLNQLWAFTALVIFYHSLMYTYIDHYLLGHQRMYEVSQITPRAIFVIFQSGPAEKLPILPPFSPDNPKSKAPSVGNIFGHSIVLSTIHRLPSIPNPTKKKERGQKKWKPYCSHTKVGFRMNNWWGSATQLFSMYLRKGNDASFFAQVELARGQKV